MDNIGIFTRQDQEQLLKNEEWPLDEDLFVIFKNIRNNHRL